MINTSYIYGTVLSLTSFGITAANIAPVVSVFASIAGAAMTCALAWKYVKEAELTKQEGLLKAEEVRALKLKNNAIENK